MLALQWSVIKVTLSVVFLLLGHFQISSVNCSGNGACIDGICTCDGGWDGAACHLRKCPDDCGVHENRGACEPERG